MEKHLWIALFLLVLSYSQSRVNQASASPTIKGMLSNTQQMNQVFNEDFNWVGGIDTSRWYFDIGNNNGWGNNELEYYTNRPDNIYTDGYVCVIKANKESYSGYGYTSARINTVQGWTYGTFVVKAQLPTGKGVWPAIWLLPKEWTYGNGSWPDNGEIDIMESVGYDPNTIHFSLHNHNGTPKATTTTVINGAASSYHEYKVEWMPDHITGYVDDVEYFRYRRNGASWMDWPYDKPFYLIINNAIGGTWGGAQGVDDTIFPAWYFIDYVRVYKRISSAHNSVIPAMPGRIQAEDYDDGGMDYAYHTDLSNNPGAAYRNDQVGIEKCTDTGSGYNVGWFGADTWLNYTFSVNDTKSYGLTFRVASPYSGKSFNVEIDDRRVGVVTIPNTGGWQNWQSVTLNNINIGSGTHTLRVLANNDGMFNLNWLDIWKYTPTIASTNPTSIPGAKTFTLTVNGTNFVSGSIIKWNGTNIATTYVSSTQLTASINMFYTTLTTYPAVATVSVLNPDGSRSAGAQVTVTAPLRIPTISSLSPSSVNGAKTFTLTVSGTNFVSGTIIKWNGTNMTTTYVSPTQLTAPINKFYSTLPSYPGSVTITILNPDGSRSAGAILTILNP